MAGEISMKKSIKIVRFINKNKICYGKVEGSNVYKLKDNIFDEIEESNEVFSLSEVEILAPVDPGKIICVGLNYLTHVEDIKDRKPPEEPVLFMVSPSSIIAHNDIIKLPYEDHLVQEEAELVVVIGKKASNIKPQEVLEYVFGYTIGNDVSDRTIQRKDGQWTRGKSFYTYKPIGPYIVTDLNSSDLTIEARINGITVQKSSTSSLIYSVSELISFISRIMTLNPGDIVFTGTPGGPAEIRKGDVCEVEIQRIGILRNMVE